LNDCSDDLTGEHFMSEVVLRELADGGKTVLVRGFPWQTNDVKSVGIRALESRMLCGRHNSALSGLDTQAGRLFRVLRGIDSDLRAGVGRYEVKLFTGVDVERWMLKTLIGLASSGNARERNGTRITWSVPDLWLKILFGPFTFTRSWGLYVSARVGDPVPLDPRHVGFAPLMTDGVISGLQAQVADLRLCLAMRDVGVRRAGAIDDDSMHRPNELLFCDARAGTRRSLCFAWAFGLVGGQIQLDWRAP
jgi:hypothetical protein